MIHILGIIFFLIEWYIIKHTVYFKYKTYYTKTELSPIIVRRWHLYVMFLFNMIPYFNIVFYIIFIVGWCIKYADNGNRFPNNTCWRIKSPLLSKVSNFLNKEV